MLAARQNPKHKGVHSVRCFALESQLLDCFHAWCLGH